MRRVPAVLVLTVLLMLSFSAVGWAAEVDQPYISVSGESTVEVAANRVDINVAVVTEGTDVKTAQAQNAKIAEKLIEALNNAGIKQQNIMTSGYNIQPNYDYARDGQPQLIGYRVVNEVKVTVEDVSTVGSIIDTAVQNGANEVRNISFYAVGNTEQKIAALRQAVENARQKAEVLAGALGKEIVGVKSASGNWFDQSPSPIFYDKTEAQSTPINPGKVIIRATAEIVYFMR